MVVVFPFKLRKIWYLLTNLGKTMKKNGICRQKVRLYEEFSGIEQSCLSKTYKLAKINFSTNLCRKVRQVYEKYYQNLLCRKKNFLVKYSMQKIIGAKRVLSKTWVFGYLHFRGESETQTLLTLLALSQLKANLEPCLYDTAGNRNPDLSTRFAPIFFYIFFDTVDSNNISHRPV